MDNNCGTCRFKSWPPTDPDRCKECVFTIGLPYWQPRNQSEEITAGAIRQSVEKHCFWEQDEDGIWQTDCGKQFYFDDSSTPEDTGMIYCCFCRKPLKEIEYREHWEDYDDEDLPYPGDSE